MASQQVESSANIKARKLIAHSIYEYHRENKPEALKGFKRALDYDPENEVALVWCAKLSTDPFEARVYLRRILKRNPRHTVALRYYQAIEKRCVQEESERPNRKGALKGNTANLTRQRNIGESLVKRGLLSDIQLKAVLHYQECMLQEGCYYRLGEILQDFGYTTAAQLVFGLEQYSE
jgi:tetratricopeptide (TPR) repeat protein